MNGQAYIGAITPKRYFYSIAVALGLLFAMVADDQEKSLILLLMQWQFPSIVPMYLLFSSHIALLKLPRVLPRNNWLALFVSGIIGASLFAPLALLLDLWIETTVSESGLVAELLDEWLNVAPPVALCWIFINAPWQLGYRIEKSGHLPNKGTEASDGHCGSPKFMDLVPENMQGDIIFLKSELHYLQVVTDKGSTLILYNLKDAIDDLPAETGMSVHRSYWVSFAHIEKIHKRGRQGEVQMANGDLLPISRNKFDQVSEKLKAVQKNKISAT